MKIALFHELPVGGARRAVNEFGKELKKKNVVDLYLVGESQEKEEKNFFSNIVFYKFISKEWNGGNWKIKLYKDSIELIKLYILHKKIAQEIDNKNYDFVFLNASKYTQAPFLLRFLKTKKVYYFHDPCLRIAYEPILFPSKNLDPVRKIYENTNRYIRKIIDRQNIEKGDILIANSNFAKNRIKSIYKKKSITSYCGVDFNFFRPNKTKKKDFDILFIGSYDLIDGYNLLKEAVKHMSVKPKIKALMKEDKWVSDDSELRSLYQKSRIVVCLAFNEPFGLVPLEAMACGVPVIAVNEGGYKESIINNKTGYLIKRDAKVLARKIEFLLKDYKKANYFGDNGRIEMLKKWGWKKRVNEMYKVINLDH